MTRPAVDPDLKHGRVRLASTVVLGHAIKHVYNSGFRSLIMPEIKIDLGLSRAQFGSLATARSITGGVATFTAGFLGDRFSNRAALMLGISLGLMGLTQMAIGFAPGYWTMLVVFFILGIGPSLYHPPALSALSHRFPDRRGFAVSLHGVGGIAGEVVGPLVVAGALELLIWRDVLKASVFPALVAALLIWAMMRSVPSRGGASQVASVREYLASLTALLENKALVILVLATALRAVGESAVGDFLPVYLREDLEFNTARVALYLSLAKAAGLVSQPAMGFLSDRFSRKAVLVPGAAASAVLSISFAFAGPGVQLAVVIVAAGAFSFSLHHIFIAAALDVSRGEVQSTVVALIYGAGLFGTFSPFVAGLISDRFGIHSVFLYGGSVLFLPVLLLAVTRLPSQSDTWESEKAPTVGSRSAK